MTHTKTTGTMKIYLEDNGQLHEIMIIKTGERPDENDLNDCNLYENEIDSITNQFRLDYRIILNQIRCNCERVSKCKNLPDCKIN